MATADTDYLIHKKGTIILPEDDKVLKSIPTFQKYKSEGAHKIVNYMQQVLQRSMVTQTQEHSAFMAEEKELLSSQANLKSKFNVKNQIVEVDDETKKDWMQMKMNLVQKDLSLGHAAFLHQIASMNKNNQDVKIELIVDKKLDQLRRKMLADDPLIINGSYYEKLDALMKSPLWHCFYQMPKPAVHHTHLTACADIDFLISLTYNDFVYYSERENMFYANQKHGSKGMNGYIQVNMLRSNAQDAHLFDEMLKETILLRPNVPEDHNIWKEFQPKFMLTNYLYNYALFFERILLRVCKRYLHELVTIVEFRHIFGFLMKDGEEPGKPINLTVEEELEIFDRVQQVLKQMFPLFQLKIIVCGLKLEFFGKPHIQKMLDAIEAQKDDKYQLIVGFDMVNEEDYNFPINYFLEQILATKQRMGDKFNVYLHAGESNSRHNIELYDAILLGTKRIGHGFSLAKHPILIEMVKEKNICVECCPVSNFVLGYVHDLRCHPVRGLLCQGVKVSLSPDDQGFWNANGVTLDYLYAYLAWNLTLNDLKKLVQNSLEFASISEAEKKKVQVFLDRKWSKFLAYVRGRH